MYVFDNLQFKSIKILSKMTLLFDFFPFILLRIVPCVRASVAINHWDRLVGADSKTNRFKACQVAVVMDQFVSSEPDGVFRLYWTAPPSSSVMDY